MVGSQLATRYPCPNSLDSATDGYVGTRSACSHTGLLLQHSRLLDKALDKVLHVLASFNGRNKPVLAVVQRAEHLQQRAAAGSRLHTAFACTPLMIPSLLSYPEAPPPTNL